MKQSRLAQKRHKRNLKRKQKKFDNHKHNSNLMDYCRKMVTKSEEILEV